MTSDGQCAPMQTREIPIIMAKVQVTHLILGANKPNIIKPAKDAKVCPDGIELNAQSVENGTKPVLSKASKNTGRIRPITIFRILPTTLAAKTDANTKKA